MAFLKGKSDSPQPQRWSIALEATLRLSEISASGAPLPQVTSAVVTAATEVLGAEQAVLLLLDASDRQTLVVDASAGLSSGVPAGSRLPISAALPGGVIPAQQAVRIPDVSTSALRQLSPADRTPTAAVLAPLRSGGSVAGVLYIPSFSTKDDLDADDLRVAQMFADQVAGVIQRTKLHEEAEQRSSGLTALVECTKGLLGITETEPLLHAVLDGATRLARTDAGFVCLFDRETGGVSTGVFRNIDKAEIRAITEAPSVRKAMEDRSMIVVPHPSGSKLAIGLVTTQGTQGLLVIPGTRELIEERSYLFTAFAQHCASALGASELNARIEQKETQLSSLIVSVSNPILLVDHRRCVVAMNPGAERLFQTSLDFSAGQPARSILSQPEILEGLESEGIKTGEVQIGVPTAHFRFRISDVRVPGAPLGRLLVMDDITQEREIAQTQRDFVAMIGHELRTPLTVIKGFAKMLLRKSDQMPAEALKEALDTIDHRAELLERLIEDLLYLGQIETREASLRVEDTDIHKLIQSVAVEVLEAYPDRTVDAQVPPGLRWACDEAKLALVLRHLTDNALKYSDAGVPVVVKAQVIENDLRIDVIDKGRGIVSSDIPHIFDRFRQIDGSATREHGGTGVGLYLSAQLMKLHGGRIWVDSTWGKGSTFSVSVPLTSIDPEVVTLQSRRQVG